MQNNTTVPDSVFKSKERHLLGRIKHLRKSVENVAIVKHRHINRAEKYMHW
jgi:hypothetical protein